MLKTLLAALTLTLLASATVQAAPCRDAHGKFVKCEAAKTKAVQCKDAKGKFAKCDGPGAKPIN